MKLKSAENIWKQFFPSLELFLYYLLGSGKTRRKGMERISETWCDENERIFGFLSQVIFYIFFKYYSKTEDQVFKRRVKLT